MPAITYTPPSVTTRTTPFWTWCRTPPTWGMEELCLTDHVDYGIKVDWDSGLEVRYRDRAPYANVDYYRYVTALEEARRLYGDQVPVKLGLEFGMQVHTIS